MRERRTGSRQMALGEGDEGISGASTSDESETERQARLATLEREAAIREAEADAAAAESPDEGAATPDPAADGARPVAPPAQFSGSDADGQPDGDPAPVPDLTVARAARGARGARAKRGARASK